MSWFRKSLNSPWSHWIVKHYSWTPNFISMSNRLCIQSWRTSAQRWVCISQRGTWVFIGNSFSMKILFYSLRCFSGYPSQRHYYFCYDYHHHHHHHQNTGLQIIKPKGMENVRNTVMIKLHGKNQKSRNRTREQIFNRFFANISNNYFFVSFS